MSETIFSALSNAQLAIRAAVAAAAAAAIAQWLNLDYPVYAVLAAIIATDLTPHQSRQLGLRRLAATLLGALGGALVSLTLPSSAWSAGLAILCTVFVSQRLRLRSSAKVAGYISAIVVLHFGSDPWGHAYDRFVETALGITVAWLVSFVPLLFYNKQIEARRHEQRSQTISWFQVDPEPVAAGAPTLLADAQLAARTAVAATLATLVAELLKLEYPVFAAIAAIITTDLVPAASRAVGGRRIAATIIGAACGGAASLVLNPDPGWVGGAMLITMLGCKFLNSPEGSKIAACTCGIGMLLHGGHPMHFALHRVLETCLGVATAWAVSYVPKLIRLEPESDPARNT